MAMHRKGCTKIERVFGKDEKSNGKGHYWNKVGMQYGELIVEEKDLVAVDIKINLNISNPISINNMFKIIVWSDK